MITKLRCKKHPKYQAKLYPYSECPRCLEMWEAEETFRKDSKKLSTYLAILDQRPDWDKEMWA